MRYYKVLLGFNVQTDTAFETVSKTILNSVKANGIIFPSAANAVIELEGSLPLFTAALEAAKMSDATSLTTAKNLAREQVTFLLVIIGCYVNADARGDLAKVKLSGFPLPTPKAPVAIARPEGLILQPGIAIGYMIAKITSTIGSSVRYYEITSNEPNASTIWMRYDDTRKTFTFDGLISGVKYYARVGVKNENGVMIYSEIVSQFAI